MKNIILVCCLLGSLYLLESCNMAGGDFPGREFMPDMAHSIAYEANYYNYYRNNTWGTEQEYKPFATPGKPVKGTVPRGYAGIAIESDMGARGILTSALSGKSTRNGISIPLNGHVPYHYEDTEEERARAMAEIIDNPFPITAEGLETGKSLYLINCAICHGEKGDGAGYLLRDDGGVYPAQPANFLLDEFVNASNGRYYHSIIYGKNVMGGYADKLSYEERWQVIHYIRALQAKEKKLSYTPDENTLNNTSITAAEWHKMYGASMQAKDTTVPEVPVEGEHTSEAGHGDQHEGGQH